MLKYSGRGGYRKRYFQCKSLTHKRDHAANQKKFSFIRNGNTKGLSEYALKTVPCTNICPSMNSHGFHRHLHKIITIK